MKLLRLGNVGQEIPAAIDKNGKYRNLSSHIKDFNPYTINFETLERLKKIDLEKYIFVFTSILGYLISRHLRKNTSIGNIIKMLIIFKFLRVNPNFKKIEKKI